MPAARSSGSDPSSGNLDASASGSDGTDLAERLLRRFLLLCENPRTRRRALALVRGSVSSSGAGRRFYALVNKTVVNPVARAMGIEASATRLEVVGSQLVGLAMLRYVLEVEPIASLSIDQLVPLLAPPLRAALQGDAGVPRPVEELALIPW
jgi:hypothetical protein